MMLIRFGCGWPHPNICDLRDPLASVIVQKYKLQSGAKQHEEKPEVEMTDESPTGSDPGWAS